MTAIWAVLMCIGLAADLNGVQIWGSGRICLPDADGFYLGKYIHSLWTNMIINGRVTSEATHQLVKRS